MGDEQFQKGQRVGKYEVLGLLAAGGMAELYLASLTGKGGFRKYVALKRVLPEVAVNEAFVQMFLDEARITAALSHANIAQVYELAEGPDSDEPVLAMEFVAGRDLRQVVKRASVKGVALPLGFILRVAHDVLMGLHSAHAFVEPTTGQPNPVVHRDINLRNVMVTYTGGVKIIDFGIAKARGRLGETQVGMIKGTIDYMSPEQVRATTAVDGRSDLFAVSAVVYELLTGERLWGVDTDTVTMLKIVNSPAPSLAERCADLPRPLIDAVMKGLEKDPAKRWATGRDYARALDRACDESFDEEQLSRFMGRLFADEIAFARELLASGTSPTPDLRRMTLSGDEPEALGSARAPPPTVAARGLAAPGPGTPGAKGGPPRPPPGAIDGGALLTDRGPPAGPSGQDTVLNLASVPASTGSVSELTPVSDERLGEGAARRPDAAAPGPDEVDVAGLPTVPRGRAVQLPPKSSRAGPPATGRRLTAVLLALGLAVVAILVAVVVLAGRGGSRDGSSDRPSGRRGAPLRSADPPAE